MADVFINGERVDFEDTGGDATIGEFMSSMNPGLRKEKAAITGLAVDGIEFADWTTEEVAGKRISGCSEVRFTVTPVERLALGGMGLLKDYMRHVREEAAKASEGLTKGEDSGSRALSTIIEGVAEIVKTIESLERCSSAYSIDLFRENPESCYKPALDCLHALKEAIDSGDSVSTADILEYELIPFLDDLEKRLMPADGG